MTPPNIAVEWDGLPLERVTEMASRRVAIDAGRTLVQSQFRRGALVPVHTHAAEQWIHVLQGSLAVTVAGRRTTLDEGAWLLVPARTPHEAEALDDCVVVDVRHGDVEFGA